MRFAPGYDETKDGQRFVPPYARFNGSPLTVMVFIEISGVTCRQRPAKTTIKRSSHNGALRPLIPIYSACTMLRICNEVSR